MEKETSFCCFNTMIDCSIHSRCERCGWNPEVSKNRIKHLKKERLAPEPSSTRRVRA